MARIPSSPPAAAPHDLVLVGRFGAAHGVRGEIRLKSFTGDPAAIGDYAPLLSQDGSRLFVLRTLRHVRDDMFVARVEGIADRNAAEALVNIDIYVPRSELPPPEDDEYYHSDLIGLSALLESGERLGEVVNVLNFGAGDILEIRPIGGETMLLPFTKAVVPKVDLAARSLTVVPPDVSEVRETDADAQDT